MKFAWIVIQQRESNSVSATANVEARSNIPVLMHVKEFSYLISGLRI
jgi:hypothetical protein